VVGKFTYLSYSVACGSTDAYPDLTYEIDVDPDSDFYLMRIQMRKALLCFCSGTNV
jgi:hypothetical protein